MLRTAFFFFTIVLLLVLSCAGSDRPLNPNGDSELSVLMRDMYSDALRMKAQIEKGDRPTLKNEFATLYTAKATEPAKVTGDHYKTYADAYINALNELPKLKDPEEIKRQYHLMVETCMNCHRPICPGPMVRIKNLYLQ